MPRLLRQLAAPLPVAGKRQQVAQVLHAGPVHRVEHEGSLGRVAEGIEFLAEEERLRHRELRVMTGGRGRHRLPRGLQCTSERIGRGVEPEAMFLPVQHRQHRPDLGIAWRLLDGPLQSGPRGGVLGGNDALVIAKAAQQRLIRSQLIERLETNRLAHAVRQDAVPVGNGRHDARHQVVLQREHRLGAEGAIVCLGPEMRAGRRIHELHRHAQRRPGLAQAPLHHVAGAKLPAHRANVHGFAAETPRGAARHDAEMGEPHEAHDDVLAEAVGQRFEVGVRATVLERQHRDPEPLVRTTGSGRCHPDRWLLRRQGAGKALSAPDGGRRLSIARSLMDW